MDLNRYLVDTKEKFDELVNQTKDYKVIAIDTENGGQNPLNPHYCIPAGFSVSTDGINGYYIPINHSDIKTNLHYRLQELLQNKKTVVMHNSPYDSAVIYQQYGIDLEQENLKWFDTMVAQHLIDEGNPKGLKKITERYFNYKQQEFDWDDVSKVPSTSIYKYACDDAIFTFKHYQRLKEQLIKEDLLKFYIEVEEPFQKVLRHMKLTGVYFDLEKAYEIEQQLKNDKKQIYENIIKVTPELNVTKTLIGGKKININLESNKDLTQFLYDKLNLPVVKTTQSGAPAIDSDTLSKLKNEKGEFLHPIIPELLKLRKVQKLITSYTNTLYDKVIDNRIYPEFRDVGTQTGRLSCENPNFQQLPKDDTYKIRSLFTATPEYKMYVADFSQQELRVCGHISNSPTFRKVYEEGQDLHLKVANQIWNLGISEEDIKEDSSNYKYYKEKYDKERFNAKSINFGLLYGRTAKGLQTQIGGTEEECQRVVDKYFENFPEIQTAINKSKQSIKQNGFVRNIYGRKRRFSMFNGEYYTNNVFREGFNFEIQGTCADILRIVMNKLYEYVKQNIKEVKIIGTVHDEILFEIKDNENFEKHKNQIKYIMENSVELSISLPADGDEGYTYADAK
ncbi:MAG: DNA polymerase [Candidatus Woesearchaeota archaeon]